LILVPLLPLIRVAREFAPTFWTQPRIGETALVYNNWFAHGDWVLVALVAAAALVPWVARYSPAEPVSHPPLTDVVPPAIFLALPALGALTAYATSSGFMWRYVVPGIIGFAILASYCLARLFGHSPALRVAMVTVLALNQEAIFDTRALLNPEQSETTRIERRLSGLEGGPAPVVVTSPHKFLELYYYAPNELRSRLRYIASREVSVRELGSDTADRGLILLAKVVPLPVGIYPGDLPRTSYYVVDLEPLNWLVRELARAGTRIAVVVAGDGFLIARVPGSHDAE
jgi:hypothetical protein